MVNIQDLPVEILRQILASLVDLQDETPLNPADKNYNDDDDENEYIRNVCLVSQLFRQLAQPLLFEDFDEHGLSGDIRKTISFTTAIYRRPELGKHVQSISIEPIGLGPGNQIDPQPLDAEDSALLRSAILDLQLGIREKKRWVADMKKEDVTVFAALLLNKTPGLRFLTLLADQFFPKQFTHLFQRNPSFLSSLESLEITFIDSPRYEISFYEQLLILPKLKSVAFTGGILTDASFPSTWKPGTLAIEIAAFTESHIGAGAIQEFMQACKKMTSFTYDSHDPDSLPVRTSSSEFNTAQAYKAALLHKDTLGHFEVRFEPEKGILNVEEYNSCCEKIGSFRDFSELENICIPHASLPPHPQFSPAMHALHISDCSTSIREMVQNIATDCKNGLYPKFETFRVFTKDMTLPILLPGHRIPPGQTPAECFSSIQSQFKGTKVDLQVVPYTMPNLDYGEDEEDEDWDDSDDGGYVTGGFGSGGPMPGRLMDMLMQQAGFPDGFEVYDRRDYIWESD